MNRLQFVNTRFEEWNLEVFGHLGVRKAKLVGDIERIDQLEMEGLASLEDIRM